MLKSRVGKPNDNVEGKAYKSVCLVQGLKYKQYEDCYWALHHCRKEELDHLIQVFRIVKGFDTVDIGAFLNWTTEVGTH